MSASQTTPPPVKPRFTSRLWAVAAVASLLVSLMAIMVYVDHLTLLNYQKDERTAVLQEVALIRARLEGNLSSNLQAVQGMVAAISLNPNISQDEFARLGEHLISRHNQLLNIAAAPDLIIRYMYPVRGNEAALGLDYNKSPSQKMAALRAKETGEMAVAGPLTLAQGGQGIIGRIPVFNLHNNRQRFWGLVSTVIDIERFYKASLLDEANPNLKLAIRGKDGLGERGEVFYGSEAVFNDSPATAKVILPGGHWQIGATPIAGWATTAPNAWAIRAIMILIALCVLIPTVTAIRYGQRTRENEGLLQGLFDLSPMGIALNDYATGKFLRVNRALQTLSGYALSELKERRHTDLRSPESLEGTQNRYEQLRTDGHIGPIEQTLVRQDNRTLPISMSSLLTNDSKGKPVIWSIIEDISERKKAEAKLYEAHALQAKQMRLLKSIANAQSQIIEAKNTDYAFRTVLTHLLDLTDSNMGIIGEIDTHSERECEHLFTRLASIDNSQTDKDPRCIDTPHTAHIFPEPINDLITAAIKSLQPVICNSFKHNNHDNIQPLTTFLALPIIREGKGLAVIAIANREKGYSQSIIDWLEPLTHTIGQIIENVRAQRERDEAQKELIKSKNVAESAARAKSEFLAIMSHEIRTPLNGILGMINLLRKSPLNEKQSHQATIAQHSAESLLTIINDILDFSKIDAGKLSLEYLDFDVRSMVDDVIGTFLLKAAEAGIELMVDQHSLNEPMAKGDPNRIQQVLTNLIGNAIKFTPSGYVLVKVAFSDQDQSKKLVVTITDTGIGIPAEKFNTLFDPFTQVDGSTTREFGGTGLGLAICKRLCRLMGGDIMVESTLGEGSSFTFTTTLVPSRINRNVIDLCNAKALNVLVLDTNRIHRDLLQQQLCALGAEVQCTQIEGDVLNWAQSLDDARKHCLVVGQFPVHTLSDACMAQLQSHPDLRLVHWCSAISSSEKPSVPPLHFTAELQRPIHTDNLIKVVKQLVDESFTQTPIKSAPQPHPAWSRRMKILLVEDNAVNQEVVLMLMEDLGIETEVANNGQEALHKLKQAVTPPFTAVLMDCQMPVLDGYAATRKIRQGAAGKHCQNIPIIALTANAMKGDEDKCKACGMDDYLSKPIEEQQLITQLQKHQPTSL